MTRPLDKDPLTFVAITLPATITLLFWLLLRNVPFGIWMVLPYALMLVLAFKASTTPQMAFIRIGSLLLFSIALFSVIGAKLDPSRRGASEVILVVPVLQLAVCFFTGVAYVDSNRRSFARPTSSESATVPVPEQPVKDSPVISGVVTALITLVLLGMVTLLIVIDVHEPYGPDEQDVAFAFIIICGTAISLGVYEYLRCRRRALHRDS